MKMNDILSGAKTSITRGCGKALLVAKKYAPEALLVVGGVAAVGCVVVACKETLELEPILDNHKKEMEEIEENHKGETSEDNLKDKKKEKFNVTVNTCIEVTKLYLPAAGLGVVAVGCVVSSHNILYRRYLGMVAAYEAIDKAFKNYRQNVIADQGEEKDKQYARSVFTVGDKNDGVHIDSDADYAKFGCSGYARIFEEISSINWQDDACANYVFLKCVQSEANNILHARGYLFLNEVYDMLGFRSQYGTKLQTYAGQIVGWRDDKLHTKFVDFGFSKNLDFISGKEPSVLLDFNVDGNILDPMTEDGELPII